MLLFLELESKSHRPTSSVKTCYREQTLWVIELWIPAVLDHSARG